MLYTITAILLILWILGLATGYAMGGFIHIFLVLAIILVLLRLIAAPSIDWEDEAE